MFERRWFCAVSGAAIEFQHHQVAWLRLKVHACWCQVPAWTELLRVDNVNVSRVAGKFRLRAGEFKTADLANNTPAAIATREPFALKRSITGRNSDSVVGLVKISDGKPAHDRNA